MRLYSIESIMLQNDEAENINQIIHTKQLCKNVFLEITKANLKGSHNDYIDQELINICSSSRFLDVAYLHYCVLAFSPFKRYKAYFYNYIESAGKFNVLVFNIFDIRVVPRFFQPFCNR